MQPFWLRLMINPNKLSQQSVRLNTAEDISSNITTIITSSAETNHQSKDKVETTKSVVWACNVMLMTAAFTFSVSLEVSWSLYVFEKRSLKIQRMRMPSRIRWYAGAWGRHSDVDHSHSQHICKGGLNRDTCLLFYSSELKQKVHQTCSKGQRWPAKVNKLN